MAPSAPLPAGLAEDGYELRRIDAYSPQDVVAFIHDILWTDCQMDARKQLERSVSKFFRDFSEDVRFSPKKRPVLKDRPLFLYSHGATL